MATKKQQTDKPSRILKQASCPQLSPSSKAKLTYNDGTEMGSGSMTDFTNF